MENRTPRRIASIIIPSFNSSETIGDVLNILKSQIMNESWNMEILVVDGNADGFSNDHTSEICHQQGIGVLRCQGYGAAANRNEGARQAKGELLIFLDSDCVPKNNDFVMSHINAHVSMGNSIIVAGVRSYHVTKRNLFSDIDHACNSYARDPLLHPVVEGPTNPSWFASCNFSCSRETFHKVGFFNHKEYRMAGFEDREWAIRAQRIGFQFMTISDSIVLHCGPNTWRTLTRHSYHSNYYLPQFYDQTNHVFSCLPLSTKYWHLFKTCFHFGFAGLKNDGRRFLMLRNLLGVSLWVSICSLPLVWVQVWARIIGIFIGGNIYLASTGKK